MLHLVQKNGFRHPLVLHSMDVGIHFLSTVCMPHERHFCVAFIFAPGIPCSTCTTFGSEKLCLFIHLFIVDNTILSTISNYVLLFFIESLFFCVTGKQDVRRGGSSLRAMSNQCTCFNSRCCPFIFSYLGLISSTLTFASTRSNLLNRILQT